MSDTATDYNVDEVQQIPQEAPQETVI
jgi:hypothetical protein